MPLLSVDLVQQQYLLQSCLRIHHPSGVFFFFPKEAEITVLFVPEYDKYKFVDSCITINLVSSLRSVASVGRKSVMGCTAGSFLAGS